MPCANHKRLFMSQPRIATAAPRPTRPRRPGWDVLLVAILAIVQVQVQSFAHAASLPERVRHVAEHPLLGNLLSPAGAAAFGVSPHGSDPIMLLLGALTLGFVLLYAVADLAAPARHWMRVKWLLLACIVATALVLPAGKLILLRDANGPASYTHDGGVIQTEATIRFLLDGRNPYIEDYLDTPMAEWGLNEYRTALYHYPYLPWTFLFSAPFYLLGEALGFYDQRLVYLLLWLPTLALVPLLIDGEGRSRARRRAAAVALLALNPVMALDVTFGQNDVFVLSWIVLALVCWQQWQRARPDRSWLLLLSTLCFGLACASKPTAWFFAPFYGLLLLNSGSAYELRGSWRLLVRAVPLVARVALPALLVFGVIVLPYLAWSPWHFYDDVWRWSSGQGETGYQIWGWGASNFVLALGLVADRFGQWPFWLLEIVIAGPLLLWFLRRQQQENTLSHACWHYGIFLLAFFYASRFLNENYLGYILAFLSLGALTESSQESREA